MSATKDLPVNHDIGSRISWNLRAPVSFKIDEKAIKAGKKVKPWLERRKDMKSVCSSCHGRNTVDNFYEQFDAFVELFNDKFAIPSKQLITLIKKEGLIDKTKFNDEIEWTYFYLWHHEGRRARHGAAMLAPDYVHWEGMFEIAHRFYFEMVPQIKELIKEAHEHNNKKGADKVQAKLDEILNSEMHRWFLGKKPPKSWSPEDSDNHGFKASKK